MLKPTHQPVTPLGAWMWSARAPTTAREGACSPHPTESSRPGAFKFFAGLAALWLGLSAVDLFGQAAGPQDFGDAPLPYPTVRTNNGAQHAIIQGFHLGSRVDGEPDGQPNPNALGDDSPSAVGPGDEDGVRFDAPLLAGQKATVNVVASEKGMLDAWIDFEADGSWKETSDQIYASLPVNAGLNALTFLVPANARAGFTFARFRFSQRGGLLFTGPAPDGEVEDHRVQIGPTEVMPGQGPPPCDLTNKGTDFWLTFPANYAPDLTNRPQLSLQLAGPTNVTGQVAIPGLAFVANWTIPSGGVATVNLPWQADLGELNDGVTNKGIHITASGEISVYALNHVPFTSDAFLALPNSVLGTDYLVLGYPNVLTDVPELNGTQFAIVATENNTSVTITPRVATGLRAAGVPFTVAMNRGDTYQLRNTNSAPNDLTGSLISANKPIGVWSGHRCANITGAAEFFSDTVVEQLPPTAAWGTNFVAMPLATRLNGDSYRIVAAQANTIVRLNGAIIATLQLGEVHERLVTNSVQITSDKPVLVAQYANSSDYDLVTNSDPFMVLIPATKLFREDYVVFSMTNGFTTNFVNVVVPNSLTNQIAIDGVPVPSARFSPIPAAGPPSGFSGAQLPVAPGKHTLTQALTNLQPFGVTVYGFAEYDSYGYPAGMRFGDLQPPIITCPNSVIVTVLATNCVATVPTIQASVRDNCTPENVLKIAQVPPAGTPLGPGTYEVVLSSTDLAGNIGRCISLLRVLDPNQPTIQCPSNIVVRTRSVVGEIVNFKVTAGTPCSPSLDVVCSPASGTLFPLGTTTVTCSIPGGDTSQTPSRIPCNFTVSVIPLRIDVSLNQKSLVFRWAGNDILESASSVSGPWKEVPRAQSPYTISLSEPALGERQFYRLRCSDCP